MAAANGDGNPRLVVRHAALPAVRSCPLVFDITQGTVMGLRSPSPRESPHSEFPIWATILLAVAGVLLLSGIAFVVIKLRSPPAASATARGGRGRRNNGHGKRGGVRVQVGAGVEDGEEATLKDPLLLGEEGKAGDGGRG